MGGAVKPPLGGYVEFMGAHDYFMAHAPFPPPKWFMPAMRDCPAVPGWRKLQKEDIALFDAIESFDLTGRCDDDRTLVRIHEWKDARAAATVAQADWQAEFRRETWLQWPSYYADQMLQRRA